MAGGSSSSCNFIAGGDVAPNRPNPKRTFGRLTPLLQEADLAFANIETPLARSGRPAAGKIILRGAPEMAEALLEAQFGALCFANNHALDYGEEAFFETLDQLDRFSLPSVGAGKNLAAARKPCILERNGLRFGLLAYCSVLPAGFAAGPKNAGINPLRAGTAYRPPYAPDVYPGVSPEIITWAKTEDLRRMAREIRSLRKKVDFLFANHHWGTSMVHDIRTFQHEIAHAAIDAGADLVLGGHPHVLQGIEYYKGRPIVYSMGNLVFDFAVSFFTAATCQTFLFGCAFTKKGVRDPYLLPCRIGRGGTPELLSPRRGPGGEIVRFLGKLSDPLGTRLKIMGDRVAVLPHPS